MEKVLERLDRDAVSGIEDEAAEEPVAVVPRD